MGLMMEGSLRGSLCVSSCRQGMYSTALRAGPVQEGGEGERPQCSGGQELWNLLSDLFMVREYRSILISRKNLEPDLGRVACDGVFNHSAVATGYF